ncbi:NADH dehydrogenase [Baekduia alba]|uniref:NAD(P)/FAD-dependent oxidoreductase n=1 Tax=Baekduia alba TaxID=2997333 RepID=UPI00233FF9DB|nr:NAD(P)/FAD-dependent oxidoreductase [Baekduia alba]WCB95174.1 NADH dehydrogenase [Baekduia alba]
MSDAEDQRRHVVVVGGGFAGVGATRRLAGRDDVRVTLIDRNNYHQFQPLLYQVATSQLASSDIAYSLRKLFAEDENVAVKLAEVETIDAAARSVTTTDGDVIAGDAIIVAAGSQPNFFRTPGAAEHAFPLYSLDDALALRSRILGVFEAADRDASLIDQGALAFVVVGGGPTGVELAGALADLVAETMAEEYHDLAVSSVQIHLVDLGPTLLGPFSEDAHEYVAKILGRKGVRMHLGVAVTEVGAGHVTLADGTAIRTRCVVWGGGIKAPPVAGALPDAQGRGGRLAVSSDLSVAGAPGIYAAGDIANIPAPDGSALPQLGSVALQSGVHAANTVMADLTGEPRSPFHYHDKGIMAMIGRGAAIAEVGPHRHELHGAIAFSAWLGVHAQLMTGVRNRIDAFVSWGSDYFSKRRGPQILDHTDAAEIDWDEDPAPPLAAAGHPQP